MYLVMDGERVRELREEKGWCKRQLAEAAGISPTTVRRLEHGDPVYFSTGRRVADALGEEPSPSLGRVLSRT